MKKVLFIITFILLLTGCYDRIELEQQAYVIIIGVDKTDRDGIYEYTFQIANPEVGTSANGGSSEPATEIVSVEGGDILSATNTANAFVAKRMTLDHTKAIVTSEELARSDDFMRVIQAATRSPQLRRTIRPIVSKEKASEFVNNFEPLIEKRPHKFYQFLLQSGQEIGFVPDATLHRFFQITEGDADLFLGIFTTTILEQGKENHEGIEDDYIAGEVPQQGGTTTQFMGSAVFKEGKMIDTFTGEETRITYMLDPTVQMDNIIATIKDPLDPRFLISYQYKQKKKPKISIDYSPDQPTKINVDVYFVLEVIAIPSLIPYPSDNDKAKKLQQAVIDALTQKSEELIKKSQEEYGSDPFYWSLYVRSAFKDIPEYEKADWHNDIFPNAEIDVNFHVQALEFGKTIKDIDLRNVRD